MATLSKFEKLRRRVMEVRRQFYTRVWKMTIDPTAKISLKAHLDRTYGHGIFIGAHSSIAFGAVILAHDRCRGLYLDTVIEENTLIGARSIVLPGVRVGHNSIVGAGSVVTKDVPPHSVVAGNPARVVKEGVDTIEYGRMRNATQTTLDMKAAGLLRR